MPESRPFVPALECKSVVVDVDVVGVGVGAGWMYQSRRRCLALSALSQPRGRSLTTRGVVDRLAVFRGASFLRAAFFCASRSDLFPLLWRYGMVCRQRSS
jgi:hypothetical protein